MRLAKVGSGLKSPIEIASISLYTPTLSYTLCLGKCVTHCFFSNLVTNACEFSEFVFELDMM